MTLNKVIFDVDGTLMNIEHRRHLVSDGNNDWKTFMDPEVMKGDTPNQDVVDMAIALQAKSRTNSSSSNSMLTRSSFCNYSFFAHSYCQ